MWRGPHDNKPKSEYMLDTLDCRVMNIDRSKLHRLYSKGILREIHDA